MEYVPTTPSLSGDETLAIQPQWPEGGHPRYATVDVLHQRRPLLKVICRAGSAAWVPLEDDVGSTNAWLPTDPASSKWYHRQPCLRGDDSVSRLVNSINDASGKACRMLKDRIPCSSQHPLVFVLSVELTNVFRNESPVEDLLTEAVELFLARTVGVKQIVQDEKPTTVVTVAMRFNGLGTPFESSRALLGSSLSWRGKTRIMVFGSGSHRHFQSFRFWEQDPYEQAHFLEKAPLPLPRMDPLTLADGQGVYLPAVGAIPSGVDRAQVVQKLKEGLIRTKWPAIIGAVMIRLGATADAKGIFLAASSFMERWIDSFIEAGNGSGKLPGEGVFVAPLWTRQEMEILAPVYVEAISAIKDELPRLLEQEVPRWNEHRAAASTRLQSGWPGTPFYQNRSTYISFESFFAEAEIKSIEPERMRRFFNRCIERAEGMKSAVINIDEHRHGELRQWMSKHFRRDEWTGKFIGRPASKDGEEAPVILELNILRETRELA